MSPSDILDIVWDVCMLDKCCDAKIAGRFKECPLRALTPDNDCFSYAKDHPEIVPTLVDYYNSEVTYEQ